MKPGSVVLCALFVMTAVSADDALKRAPASTPIMQSFDDLKWSTLPERPTMKFAVLTGDPKSGPYTQLRQVPADTRNPLHSHSSDLTNVIIRGTWYTGAEEASARDFGPGSVVFMPGNWVHVSGCRAGSDCVFYQNGKEKFDFHPIATKPGA